MTRQRVFLLIGNEEEVKRAAVGGGVDVKRPCNALLVVLINALADGRVLGLEGFKVLKFER